MRADLGDGVQAPSSTCASAAEEASECVEVAGATEVDLFCKPEPSQKNQRLVIRAHKDALIATRTFWQVCAMLADGLLSCQAVTLCSHCGIQAAGSACPPQTLSLRCLSCQVLLHTNVPFTALATALNEIERTVQKAESSYKLVLGRYPGNPKITRTYARFLENVVNNPWKAAKYYALADRLTEQQEADEAAGAELAAGEGGRAEAGAEVGLEGGADRQSCVFGRLRLRTCAHEPC
jgi:hypothetical protein